MLKDRTNGLRREQPIEKAARLLREGRVVPLRGARVYEVRGDTDTYRVIATQAGVFCPCPARTPMCAHVLGAAQIDASERGGVPTWVEEQHAQALGEVELTSPDPFERFERKAAFDRLDLYGGSAA